MRSIGSITGTIIIGALLAATPHPVFAQAGPSVQIDARSGAQIQTDQLAQFIARNVSFRFTDMRPLSVTLGAELISRAGGSLAATRDSRPLEVEPGQSYPASSWTAILVDSWDEALAPGFGDRRKVEVIGSGTFKYIEEVWTDQRCETATHAIVMRLLSDDEPFVKNGQPMVCLREEG